MRIIYLSNTLWILDKINVLNTNMWINELGELYNESQWSGGLTNPGPPNPSGWEKPRETQLGLSYKGSFARGGGDFNPITQATFEQEEDEMISKNSVLQLVEKHLGHLDSKNRLDDSAILHLSQLKKDLLKL